MEIGSKIPELQRICAEFFMTCAEHGIRIVPRWLGRRHLQEEVDGSKLVDKGNYSLDALALEALDELSGGRHTHDRFATCENRRAG